MVNKQLLLVLKVEKDKEDRLVKDLQQAQNYLVSCQDKLEGLKNYRNEYLKQVQLKGIEGADGRQYTHTQSFIEKLELACQQQRQVIGTAKQVVEQRRSIWLEQRRKTQAVESLIQKQKDQWRAVQVKQEQATFDEFATNSFLRKQQSL